MRMLCCVRFLGGVGAIPPFLRNLSEIHDGLHMSVRLIVRFSEPRLRRGARPITECLTARSLLRSLPDPLRNIQGMDVRIKPLHADALADGLLRALPWWGRRSDSAFFTKSLRDS